MSRFLLVLSFPFAFAGVWSGDDRWFQTAVLLCVAAAVSAYIRSLDA